MCVAQVGRVGDAPDPRPPFGGANDRLNGWKEISTYLGRGVRTAQRWERDLGLPIHRLETKGAEVVYAFRGEIDEWWRSKDHPAPSADQDDESSPPVSPLSDVASPDLLDDVSQFIITASNRVVHPSVRFAARSLLLVSIITVGAAVLTMWPAKWRASALSFADPRATGKPAHWRVENRTLRVFDANMRPLWDHVFEFPIDQGVYDAGFPVDGQAPIALMDDLDRDGRPEVLFVPWATSARFRRLYCFRSDGQIAFVAPIPLTGDGNEDAVSAGRFAVADGGGGAKHVWLAVSNGLAPTAMVEKLDAEGRILDIYRADGELSLLRPARIAGRRVMLLGGTRPESASATLTVVDYEHPGGAAPGLDPNCASCTKTPPIAYLRFPASDVAREFTGQPRVDAVEVASNGAMTVSVLQARVIFPRYVASLQASITYLLTPDFRPASAMPSEAYLQAHSELHLLGRLDHRFGADDRALLFPLTSFLAGTLQDLTASAR